MAAKNSITPRESWLGQAVIYQIFIDRFYRGGGWRRPRPDDSKPVFCGGDLQGVTEKLDYLADLGINTLWLTPFNPTPAYHGYHVTDFFGVEKRFGGERAFDKLVQAAQARNIRLIMDFVANHVHRGHPWFQSARASRRSRHRGWFYWRKNGDYLKFLHFDDLPKLHLDNPDARAEIIRAAKFWIDRGIAGLRLDHALGPSLKFWREFRRLIKAHNPDVALIGEVAFWGIERAHLASIRLPNKEFYFTAQQTGWDVLAPTMREYAEVFDGLLDFHFQKVMEFIARSKRRVPRSLIQDLLDQHYASFPRDCLLLSFLDNHDMDRFLFESGNDKSRLRRAAEIQFAQSSPPVIYYGTESGMSQKRRIAGDYGDLQARRIMNWSHPDRAMIQTYRKLIRQWKAKNKL